MSESYAPEFPAWWQQQGAQAVARAAAGGGDKANTLKPIDITQLIRKYTQLKPGELGPHFVISPASAHELLPAAARQAAGFIWPTQDTEVLWSQGGHELAVSIADVGLSLADGLVTLRLTVRCDQTGRAPVEVAFACGSASRPAGLYTATPQRPSGPAVVVALWGEALVAFAWHCLLNLVCGAASASGKDLRGNVLVPVDLAASKQGLLVQTMARHHFYGSSGLKTP